MGRRNWKHGIYGCAVLDDRKVTSVRVELTKQEAESAVKYLPKLVGAGPKIQSLLDAGRRIEEKERLAQAEKKVEELEGNLLIRVRQLEGAKKKIRQLRLVLRVVERAQGLTLLRLRQSLLARGLGYYRGDRFYLDF